MNFFISASLFPGGRRGVWFRVLYDVRRRYSNARAAGSPLNKGNRYYYVDKAWLIFLIFKRQCRQSELVKIRLKQTVLDDAVFLNCSMLSGVSEFPTCHLRQYVQILHKLNNNQITYLELPKIPR